ncbi:MAG: hypothetical protein HY521_10690 [Proteobacteria bacterium]|nr:hypothetical protein [Pseudomonadota bacterium]
MRVAARSVVRSPADGRASGGGQTAGVLVKDRYTVYPGAPVPACDGFRVTACEAEDKRDPKRSLIALVCGHGLPIRSTVAGTLMAADAPGLMRIVDQVVVDWPPASAKIPIVLYDRPGPVRAMNALTDTIRPIAEPELIARIIKPIAGALGELQAHGITHRAIRPDNIFFNDARGGIATLGDCVTVPPGMGQPAVVETIESGQCRPEGRGPGTFGDDLYAFAVTALFLHLGYNPLATVDDNSMLISKMELGSYNALVGDHRLSPTMLEFFRGLLNDDPLKRWGIADVSQWLDGRHVTIPVPKPEVRASRAFKFQGRDFYTPRGLAHAMARKWDGVAKTIKESDIDAWVRRALESPDLASAIASNIQIANYPTKDPKLAEELLVARTCFALDPYGPIRYQGVAAMPDGFGAALAVAVGERGESRVFSDILIHDVPRYWFEVERSFDSEQAAMDKTFAQLRAFVQSADYGQGIERCLYELNPTLPCQSPLIRDEYVTEPAKLLGALDRKSKRGDSRTLPVDRHIAAFVAARLNMDFEAHLKAMSQTHERDKAVLGMLNFLATLQYRFGPKKLPGLSAWFGALSVPMIGSYYSRHTRKELETEVPRLVRRGQLTDLYNLFENPEERARDRDGYQAAVQAYSEASKEVQDLEVAGGARAETAHQIGQQAAALASTLIALVTLVGVFMFSL